MRESASLFICTVAAATPQLTPVFTAAAWKAAATSTIFDTVKLLGKPPLITCLPESLACSNASGTECRHGKLEPVRSSAAEADTADLPYSPCCLA